ncbi:nucleotidyl transferase AbiEii/AbiGii toxin family protein [Chloroflexota bacterium]|nr:nucleotidyl transferase AbiEii/AbiGii toxin family protein [Chloroflexota bacterium]
MIENYLRPEDLYHKSQLNRLLIEIVDKPILANSLAFKGGTCAAMLGYLDRFSVDLDFDQLTGTDTSLIRQAFEEIFVRLGFELLVAFDTALIFQLRYPNEPGKRNKLKVFANSLIVRADQYKVHFFPEIDRLVNCQTIETMFANKLVALSDRFKLHGSIAARDLYDVHHFFIKGYSYNSDVIIERTGYSPKDYFISLQVFIREHITQRMVNEDLNSLLPNQKFQSLRKLLIPETLSLLKGEVSRLSNSGKN